jgi:hypothetical protein
MTSEPLLRLDLRARNATQDAPRAEEPLVLPRAVALVAVELVRPAPRPPNRSADRRDRIEEFCEERDLVPVGRRDELGEGNAGPVDHKMALRARFATICWIRPSRSAPRFAGTVEASTAARVQSIRSASRNRLSSSCWSAFQTPAACQSRSRRQHVMPEPRIDWAGQRDRTENTTRHIARSRRGAARS